MYLFPDLFSAKNGRRTGCADVLSDGNGHHAEEEVMNLCELCSRNHEFCGGNDEYVQQIRTKALGLHFKMMNCAFKILNFEYSNCRLNLGDWISILVNLLIVAFWIR